MRKLAADFPESEKVSRSRDSRVLYEQFSTLEDAHPSPQELQSQDLPRLIRCESRVLDEVPFTISYCLAISRPGRKPRVTMRNWITLPSIRERSRVGCLRIYQKVMLTGKLALSEQQV